MGSQNGFAYVFFVIGSGLSEFADAATLKKDGRRISLEGVLTGAALGIMLLYLTEEAFASGLSRPAGGRLDEPGDDALGRLKARVGSIAILPLNELEDAVANPRLSVPANLGSSEMGQSPIARGGGDGAASSRIASLPFPAAPATFGGVIDNAMSGFGRGGEGGASSSGTSTPLPTTPGTVIPKTPNPEPSRATAPLPPLFLVIVRNLGNASSRSVEGAAESLQNSTQVGIENSVLDLRDSPFGTGFRLDSERSLQSFPISELNNADLTLLAEHIGLSNTTLLQGDQSNVLIVNARDLLELGLLTPKSATAAVNSRTLAMQDSDVYGIISDHIIAIEGLTNLAFNGLDDSERAQLSFDLLTTALKNSGILLGDGNDLVTINSGFYGSARDGLLPQADAGISFELGQLSKSLEDGSNWNFSLNAKAVGLDNSLLDMGAGDDRVSIMTRIDADLSGDLGVLYDDPFTKIKLERIGLINSEVRLGSGNDELRVNGSVIDSIIDLGSGANTLIVEGDLLGTSRILMGDGNNSISVNSQLGGQVSGGSGDDRFNLGNLQLAGELDGGSGRDSLIAPSLSSGRREVLVLSGDNSGNLGGLRFRNIETVDLGAGDDIVLLDLDASLTGQLLGGNGLDRLEYNNWISPVNVDLDRGVATAIGAGAAGSLAGFEQVIGGLGNDTLSSSGAFAGIDGSDGDDLLFLRWSPWLSNGGQGLQVQGGFGKDLIVFSGLEQATPIGWDGLSGLPDLIDMDLSVSGNGGIGLTDSIGWQRSEPVAGGGFKDTFLKLTPTGVSGVGDARLLPIAPIDQLLAGMSSDTRQLAIAVNGQDGGQLVLLGSQGIGTSQPIANLPSSPSTQGWSTISG